MISNIRDHRTRQFRWANINAIIENAWHDNGCDDADQAERSDANNITYAERRGVTLHEAIVWAENTPASVTLYLYDPDMPASAT